MTTWGVIKINLQFLQSATKCNPNFQRARTFERNSAPGESFKYFKFCMTTQNVLFLCSCQKPVSINIWVVLIEREKGAGPMLAIYEHCVSMTMPHSSFLTLARIFIIVDWCSWSWMYLLVVVRTYFVTYLQILSFFLIWISCMLCTDLNLTLHVSRIMLCSYSCVMVHNTYKMSYIIVIYVFYT